ncbi:TPA: hypothetical protein ACH3X1_000097 [Trebouxia sp. C0004]
MRKSYAVSIIAALCLLASARAQSASTTYNITLTGPQNSPPISDPTVGQAFLAISFNTASNNITYQLYADNITEVMAAHIHISSTVGANGSVSIPLYQAPFVGLPGSTSTGLLAASALMPAVFVGPYLEILPDYTNVNVSAVLTQYVQTGLAYAQVCCKTAWSCMLCPAYSYQTAYARTMHAEKSPPCVSSFRQPCLLDTFAVLQSLQLLVAFLPFCHFGDHYSTVETLIL